MGKPTAVDSLKESIRLLEFRQAEEGKIFKQQLKLTFESLKPSNIIKSSIRELANSTDVKNNLFETVVSIASGYFAKKIIIDSKSSLFNKIVRGIAHFGITNFITNNAEDIRHYISNLFSSFVTPKEKVQEKEV